MTAHSYCHTVYNMCTSWKFALKRVNHHRLQQMYPFVQKFFFQDFIKFFSKLIFYMNELIGCDIYFHGRAQQLLKRMVFLQVQYFFSLLLWTVA